MIQATKQCQGRSRKLSPVLILMILLLLWFSPVKCLLRAGADTAGTGRRERTSTLDATGPCFEDARRYMQVHGTTSFRTSYLYNFLERNKGWVSFHQWDACVSSWRAKIRLYWKVNLVACNSCLWVVMARLKKEKRFRLGTEMGFFGWMQIEVYDWPLTNWLLVLMQLQTRKFSWTMRLSFHETPPSLKSDEACNALVPMFFLSLISNNWGKNSCKKMSINGVNMHQTDGNWVVRFCEKEVPLNSPIRTGCDQCSVLGWLVLWRAGEVAVTGGSPLVEWWTTFASHPSSYSWDTHFVLSTARVHVPWIVINRAFGTIPLTLGLGYFLWIWPHKIFDPWNFDSQVVCHVWLCISIHCYSVVCEGRYKCRGHRIGSLSGVSVLWRKLLFGKNNLVCLLKNFTKMCICVHKMLWKICFGHKECLLYYSGCLILPEIIQRECKQSRHSPLSSHGLLFIEDTWQTEMQLESNCVLQWFSGMTVALALLGVQHNQAWNLGRHN